MGETTKYMVKALTEAASAEGTQNIASKSTTVAGKSSDILLSSSQVSNASNELIKLVDKFKV